MAINELDVIDDSRTPVQKRSRRHRSLLSWPLARMNVKQKNIFDAGVQLVVAKEGDWTMEPSSAGRWLAGPIGTTVGTTLLRLPSA